MPDFKILFSVILLFLLVSCVESINSEDVQSDPANANITELIIPSDFNFETTSDIEVGVEVMSITDQPLTGVKVSFYTSRPDFGGKFLSSSFTDNSGHLNTKVHLPTHIDSLFVQVHSAGFANQDTRAIAPYMNFEFGGSAAQGRPSNMFTKSVADAIPISENYYYMGSYNGNGLPDYLEPIGDNLTQQFLDDVNASLPEGNPVPVANPEYLATGNQLDIVINDMSDVWVTFVTEGAGYRNALGYYVFDTNNPPVNVSQIDSVYVVLPNASLSGAGGQLSAGDKVKLGTFEAGKTISWVLFQNAWNGPSGTVKVNKTKFYSRSDFNTSESDPSMRQHAVQLADFGNERLLNGFEDLTRSGGGSDDDFNDLVFYVSANPWEAIETGNIPQTTPSTDSDGDGISDENDEFPNDASKALRNTFKGSLAYEDLWPSQGDYDFNDMVIDYEIDHVLNGSNLLVDIEADWKIKAVGAGFQNGFGVEFDNLLPNDISNISGLDLQEGIATLNSNKTESNQSNATVIFFENVYNHIQSSGGEFINTVKDNPYTTPVTLSSVISFNSPISQDLVGFPPYDAFIFADGDRAKEIHLPSQTPTDLADSSLFHTSADATDPSTNYYYKTENGLPWAIDIPETFDYPVELSPINEAYLNFSVWASSGGSLNRDWYLNASNNRNSSKIY
jgi:LruC domain-containing protein